MGVSREGGEESVTDRNFFVDSFKQSFKSEYGNTPKVGSPVSGAGKTSSHGSCTRTVCRLETVQTLAHLRTYSLTRLHSGVFVQYNSGRRGSRDSVWTVQETAGEQDSRFSPFRSLPWCPRVSEPPGALRPRVSGPSTFQSPRSSSGATVGVPLRVLWSRPERTSRGVGLWVLKSLCPQSFSF